MEGSHPIIPMFYPKIHILLDQSRYTDAEAAIREELNSSIEDPYLFFLLSIALLNQEKPREGETAAREAISLDPDFPLAFLMVSRCLLAQSKKREALEAIEEAIQMDPEDAVFHCQKAQVYVDWGKYDKALKAAEEGLTIDPTHEDCRFFRSITLQRLGRSAEADAESESLLADSPDDYHNHCARGWVLAQRGDKEGAERHFVEALRINPDGEDARAGLTFVFRLKSPILGTFLRILIWMERIPWWILIIGVFVSMRFASEMAASDHPAPIPQIALGVRILFWGFFLIALIIHPLFNLILLTSKTARHALSNDERQAVKWFVVPLLISLGYLAWWSFKGSGVTPIHAIVWAAVVRFIYEIYETSNESVRNTLTGISVLVLLAAIWIEIFTYGYLIPQTINLFVEHGESLRAAQVEGEELGDEDRANNHAFFLRLTELATLKRNFVNYVAIALWLLACFSDDISGFLRRRAPD